MQDEWVIEDSLYSPDAHLLTSSAVCGRSNAMEICVHSLISGPSSIQVQVTALVPMIT